MSGKEQAGCAPGFGGEAETAGEERCLDFDLAEGGDQRPALQPLFQRPGRVLRMARLDDEKAGRVQAEAHESGAVRAPPFVTGALRQTPQHEPGCCVAPRQALADHGKGEGERRRGIAVGSGPDLVQTVLLEPVEGGGVLLLPLGFGMRRLGNRQRTSLCKKERMRGLNCLLILCLPGGG